MVIAMALVWVVVVERVLDSCDGEMDDDDDDTELEPDEFERGGEFDVSIEAVRGASRMGELVRALLTALPLSSPEKLCDLFERAALAATVG